MQCALQARFFILWGFYLVGALQYPMCLKWLYMALHCRPGWWDWCARRNSILNKETPPSSIEGASVVFGPHPTDAWCISRMHPSIASTLTKSAWAFLKPKCRCLFCSLYMLCDPYLFLRTSFYLPNSIVINFLFLPPACSLYICSATDIYIVYRVSHWRSSVLSFFSILILSSRERVKCNLQSSCHHWKKFLMPASKYSHLMLCFW